LGFGSVASRDEHLAKKWKISGDDHFFVKYDKRCRDPQGLIVKSVIPTGMSGGALFDLGLVTALNIGSSSMPEPKLSGVLIEHKKDRKRLVAVKIGLVLRTFMNSELAKAIN
jgi:hypothetical protein